MVNDPRARNALISKHRNGVGDLFIVGGFRPTIE
jgi:hypothetical protein